MKDSARRWFDIGLATVLATAAFPLGACGRSNKTADVAQDSMLVKDADVAEHRTDTARAPTAALIGERGSVGDRPTLTSGAPVRRARILIGGASDAAGGFVSPGRLQPPTKINPTPVLPARESISTQQQPPRVPRKDSSRDTLLIHR